MIKKTCSSMITSVNNENGFTLVLALILLMLLTIIGVTSINTSTTETMITSANEDKRTTFYAADSAIEQTTAQLYQLIRDRWQVPCLMVPGTIPNWNFALDGTGGFPAASPQPTPRPTPQWFLRYSAGVPIATGTLANGYSFDARAWNNTDVQPSASTPAQNDTDGLIIVGVIAGRRLAAAPPAGPFTAPLRFPVAVEVTLNGGLNGRSTVGTYTAQAGGGAGKNYNAADMGGIAAGSLGTMSNPGGLLR